MEKFRLQGCVDSVVSAVNAERGGATELELCGDLCVGGTTPSLALFEAVRRAVRLPVFVLLRARCGDFVYDETEQTIMLREAELFRDAGADGLVAGSLTEDGDLDVVFMRGVTERAGGVPVALHRAFDQCRDPEGACRAATELGLDYILTTGCGDDVLQNIGLIRRLRETTNARFMLGCSDAAKLRILRAETDIRSFHLSGKTAAESAARYRGGADFSVRAQSGFARFVTDPEKIRAARAALDE